MKRTALPTDGLATSLVIERHTNGGGVGVGVGLGVGVGVGFDGGCDGGILVVVQVPVLSITNPSKFPLWSMIST